MNVMKEKPVVGGNWMNKGPWNSGYLRTKVRREFAGIRIAR